MLLGDAVEGSTPGEDAPGGQRAHGVIWEDPLEHLGGLLVLARALWKSGDDLTRAFELAVRARDLAGAIAPTDTAGMQRLLGGGSVPAFTDNLIPAGLGAINRNTRGR